MVYPEALKAAIVAQHKNGVSVKQLSTEYGICARTIYRWANIYGGNQAAEISNDPQQYSAKEYHTHVRHIAKLENIISVLKTVNCTVHAPLKERLLELEQLYGQYDVHTLCEALEVSRGTFYNHILRNKRSNAWFEKRREEYRVLVQEVFDEYRQVLGAEKIRAILVQRGHKVSTAYVASLLRDMGLASVRTSAKHDYRKIQELEKKKNILQQQFKADRPNQIWVSDVTCFKLKDRYFYICAILDLFSRKVIAYKISKKNSTQLITTTFKMAWNHRNPETGLIFHSDRGSQYTAYQFQQLLHERSVRQSLSNPGRPHDNAVAESFFATLKKEDFYRRDYKSESEFKRGIASYIEFYNTKRPHRTLKNVTPCQMEEAFMEKQSNGKNLNAQGFESP